mgnify:CR=1 FL=1
MEQSLGFQDIIKKSLQGIDMASTLTISDIGIVLFLTFLIGVFIFYIYKATFQGILYTQSFNVSLVMVAIVTSLVIMTISANFMLSLGMVGALSIVRFRTAIKDSMDIVFMFWAISVGIANGAGFFKLSITGSIFIALTLFILTKFKSFSSPYLLVIDYEKSAHLELKNFIDEKIASYNLKSNTITSSSSELIIELRLDKNSDELVTTISNFAGVSNVVLISYNGDYVS